MKMNEITVNDLQQMLDKEDKINLIDVRENWEIKISKIDFAKHIPMQEIDKNLRFLNPNTKIIVMCKSGGRSANVCQYLLKQNYKYVYNLKGGITAWALEIDPSISLY